MEKFLVNEFGQSAGNRIYGLQQKKLQEILSRTAGKSRSQLKTLKKTIIPRVSLYKVLREECGEEKKAYDTVEKYMFTVVGRKLGKQYSMLECIPGFFYIFFRRLMAAVVSKSDNWVAELTKNDSTSVEYNITKCLWNDACIENECPELCKVFCDADHVIYGSMKKVSFTRRGTLGTGSQCCDFCYVYKKSKRKS